MKITEYDINSSADCPSELAKKYIAAVEDNLTFVEFLGQYDYSSEEEICRTVKYLLSNIAADKYLLSKRTQEDQPKLKALLRRVNGIVNDFKAFDKFPQGTAAELWCGTYARMLVARRADKFFPKNEPNSFEFLNASNTLQQMYGLSHNDMRKIKYFVQQVRAGDLFPSSLRRMLYIWGETKMTGKTTVASILCSVLNADKLTNIGHYKSDLAKELQIGEFKVPLIATCNCVMLDEAFYSDMSKTYDTFKRRITQNDGRARVVYGIEFEWKGCPNYIATSNTSLQQFIKDWNDRRYLSIEFEQQPTTRMAETELYNLWCAYVFNVPRVTDWQAEAMSIADIAFETGERAVSMEEFAIELQKPQFVEMIRSQQFDAYKKNAKVNRISLRFFVDYFAKQSGSAEAYKRRSEIEKAVLQVWGPRYGSQSYWLLGDLRERSYNLDSDEQEQEQKQMPF